MEGVVSQVRSQSLTHICVEIVKEDLGGLDTQLRTYRAAKWPRRRQRGKASTMRIAPFLLAAFLNLKITKSLCLSLSSWRVANLLSSESLSTPKDKRKNKNTFSKVHITYSCNNVTPLGSALLLFPTTFLSSRSCYFFFLVRRKQPFILGCFSCLLNTITLLIDLRYGGPKERGVGKIWWTFHVPPQKKEKKKEKKNDKQPV